MKKKIALIAMAAAAVGVQAADWSDTALTTVTVPSSLSPLTLKRFLKTSLD